MKYYISLLIIIVFISCKEEYHCGIYVGNEKIGLDSFWLRVTGFDSLQIYCNAGNRLDYNFCYPNKWGQVKFRKDSLYSTIPYEGRCKIKKIGKVYKENGGTVVAGWSFDCSGFKNDYIGGAVSSENLVGGWTITQLKYIAQFQDTSIFTPDDNFIIEDWYSGKKSILHGGKSIDIGYGSDTGKNKSK